MAKIFTGILGGFSGKVGSVIGYCMHGVAYMRGLATSHTDAQTPAQLDQRAKFGLVIAFLRPLIAVLRLGFKNTSSKMSGFASAVAYTLQHAIAGVSPVFTINYEKALICRGNLPGALNASAIANVGGEVVFTWKNNSWDFGAKATDKVVLGVYDPILMKWVTAIGPATRATCNYTITLPALFQGNAVQTYIGFTDDNEFSNGEFLSAVNVL